MLRTFNTLERLSRSRLQRAATFLFLGALLTLPVYGAYACAISMNFVAQILALVFSGIFLSSFYYFYPVLKWLVKPSVIFVVVDDVSNLIRYPSCQYFYTNIMGKALSKTSIIRVLSFSS